MVCVFFFERDVKRDVIFWSRHISKTGATKRGRLQKPLPFEREGERERERERNESALFLLFLFFLNIYIRAKRERENQTTPHGAEFEREFFHRVIVV